jgi:recombinational DNA repair protein (RecF pathway)
LVLQHAGSEGNPGLFARLGQGLDFMEVIAPDALVPRLLSQLWVMVRELGYGPVLGRCVECGGSLEGPELPRFDFASGGLRCASCQAGPSGPRLGPRARRQLEELLDGQVPAELLRPRAHLRLASDFVTYHISGGTPLRSMEVLYNLIPKPNA